MRWRSDGEGCGIDRGQGLSASEISLAWRIPESSGGSRPLRSDLASRLRVGFQPSVGQVFTKPLGRMGWQPLQDVFQVGERIDLVTIVGGDLHAYQIRTDRVSSRPGPPRNTC